MEDCVFCNIIKGKIPAAKVYEDDNSITFLDIMPANKGHCLVIPKKHYETMLDIPDDQISNLMKTAKKVAKAISLSVGNGAYNIVMNNGQAAGQIVPHAHIHIIPRFDNDALKLSWSHKKYQAKEMEEFTNNIKKFL